MDNNGNDYMSGNHIQAKDDKHYQNDKSEDLCHSDCHFGNCTILEQLHLQHLPL